jgi:hypothetical protein
MKIGFRGTRDGMTDLQKEALRQVLAEYRPTELAPTLTRTPLVRRQTPKLAS